MAIHHGPQDSKASQPSMSKASSRQRVPSEGGQQAQWPMRIAKALARAGLCSRREAERWIAEGRVSVNGERLASPARDVEQSDKIVVDGKALPAAEPPRLWRYHKPRGRVTTHRDPQDRKSVV